MHLAQFYPFARQQVGVKIYELMKAYNTSSHQLIILGGAVKLQKIKTKNITAKHLALNSLCISFLLYVIQCIRMRVPIHEEAKIKSELQAHQDTTIKKLASILSGKVNQALGEINLVSVPSKGTEAIVNSTKILHDILIDFYQKNVLSQIFVRDNVLIYLNKLRTMEITTKIQA